MKHLTHRLFLLLLVFVLTGQACRVASTENHPTEEAARPESTTTMPAVTPRPTTTLATPVIEVDPHEDEVPVVLGEDPILLWAVDAEASSNAGDPGYHASQAVGAPNTFICGDFVTAWQPEAKAQTAWIELKFEPFILPESILITQSYFPAQITKIEVITLDEESILVFDGMPDEGVYLESTCPGMSNFPTIDIDVLINRVRIHLERAVDTPWTQIDAVGVWGRVADTWQVSEPPDEEEGEVTYGSYGLKFYANRNRINDLLFEGDRLWSASNGGVVAWDLDADQPNYLLASPYAAQALALCEWDDWPQLFAGGDQRIAQLSTYFIDEEEVYIPWLEMPEEGYLGRVMALACDDHRQQIWVGYTGFLSRYDAASQTWTEFSWQDGLPDDTVRKITLIDGDVWVAIANGVAVVRDGNRLEVFTAENSGLPCPYVHGIVSDGSGTLWMASSCGLVAYDGVSWSILSGEQISGGSLAPTIMDIVTGADGQIWLADGFGTVCQFEPNTQTCSQILAAPRDHFTLDRLVVDGKGRLAVGSLFDGLYVHAGDAWFPLQTRDQLAFNNIRAITYTPDGRLWVAAGSAVQYFPAAQPSALWTTVDLPVNAQAHGFFVANDGLWIGHTQGASFIPYLEQGHMVDLNLKDIPFGLDRTVTAINKDANGLVYLGLTNGLVTWDGSELRFDDMLSDAEREKSVPPPRVNSILMDGTIARVGSSKGLANYVDGRFQSGWGETLQMVSSQGTSSVGVVAHAPHGDDLLVAIGRELFRFDGRQFELVLGLPSQIRGLYVGPYQLWLATASSGLYMVPMDDTPNIYWEMASPYVSMADRLGFQAITMSDSHTLWVGSSENGLIRFVAAFGQ